MKKPESIDYNGMILGMHKASERIKQLESEREQLIDALMFYANYENWKSPSKGFALQYDPEPSKVNKYRGSVAQTALEKAGVKFE